MPVSRDRNGRVFRSKSIGNPHWVTGRKKLITLYFGILIKAANIEGVYTVSLGVSSEGNKGDYP